MNRFVRNTAVILCYVFLFTEFAHAGKLPRLALIQSQIAAKKQAAAQMPSPLSPESIARARLVSAKKLYVVSDGSDDAFPESPALGVERLTAALRAWGAYTLVSTVAEADLVLQLRSAVTTTVVDGTTDSPSANVYHNPFFRLTLAEPATLKPLWVITTPVSTGIRKKDKADLFTVSAENLTSQVKLLAGTPLTTQEEASLKTAAPHHHGKLFTVLIIAIPIAIFTTVGVLLKKKFDDDVARSKQKQLDFCKQYNFPNCTA